MTLSVIVAVSENNVIGDQDNLPWRLSSDLKRFKSLTMGHSMIMGRKTFDSIGRLLPGRTTIILTRQPDLRVEGAFVTNSLEQACAISGHDSECFVIGGAEIYGLALPAADRIYLTRVQANVSGDTFLPKIPWEDFELNSEEFHGIDEKNEFSTVFQVYHRR